MYMSARYFKRDSWWIFWWKKISKFSKDTTWNVKNSRSKLNSTSSEIFRILRLAKNSLICRHFQLGSVERNRKPDHIASGAVILLTTEPNSRVGVSCSQLCSVVLSFKPVGRCDRGFRKKMKFINTFSKNFFASLFRFKIQNCFMCFLSLVCLSFYVFCDVYDF